MSKQTSLSKLNSKATIGQIVAAGDEAGSLLSSIGVDVKKHQKQSLRRVCRARQWSEGEVLSWIKSKCRPQNGKLQSDFDDDLTQWSTYIKEKYHTDNIDRLEEINRDFPRVRKIHNNQYVWLKEMQWKYDRFQDAIKMYYKFEANKFFPLLKKMNGAVNKPLYGTVKKLERSINIIKEDQSRIRGFMKKISDDSNEFENPPNACSTLRILNQNMKMLFSAIEEQFEIEETKLLPVLGDKIEAVY